jgi:vacuolar-type H+-ATPase subunit H
MTGAKSLLRQIRDKESDLDRELEQMAGDSRKMVEDAQREAESTVQAAEMEGSAAAGEYLRKEREKLGLEVAAMREQGRKEEDAVQKGAESRMSRAVERIVNAVLLQ